MYALGEKVVVRPSFSFAFRGPVLICLVACWCLKGGHSSGSSCHDSVAFSLIQVYTNTCGYEFQRGFDYQH